MGDMISAMALKKVNSNTEEVTASTNLSVAIGGLLSGVFEGSARAAVLDIDPRFDFPRFNTDFNLENLPVIPSDFSPLSAPVGAGLLISIMGCYTYRREWGKGPVLRSAGVIMWRPLSVWRSLCGVPNGL